MILAKRYMGDQPISDEQFRQTIITNPDILEVIYQTKFRIESQLPDCALPSDPVQLQSHLLKD